MEPELRSGLTAGDAEYPAMEMEWFAVDADGAVAVFNTADEGVYPPRALHCLPQALAAAGVQYDCGPLLAGSQWTYTRQQSDWVDRVILEVSDPEFFPKPSSHDVYDALPALLPQPNHVLYYLDGLKATELKRWMDKGKVSRAWVVEGLKYDCYGIYFYRCKDDTTEPYLRETPPPSPINVSNLPSPIATLLSAVRFDDLRFSDEVEIFPWRYFSCIGPEGELE
ncbi:MAG: hypothetical protein K2W95_07745 [Candidatus Obscuribacterales bacterium]|nr:hypothetical protein [Candidatus Obscuribacterales bacterium]